MGEKSRYRLPKEMILRGRDNFQRLFAEGRGLRSGSLVIKYRVVRTSSRSGVVTAFIVPKKHGRAVDRNRARRLMREAWRHFYPEIGPKLPEESVIHLALIWGGSPASVAKPALESIQRDMIKGIQKVISRLSEGGTTPSIENFTDEATPGT